MVALSPTYSEFPFDPAKVNNIFDACMHSPDWFARVTLAEDGTVDGVMSGFVFPMLFSDCLQASDIALYVEPDAVNRTSKARALLAAFTEWALARGASLVLVGVTVDIDNRGVDGLLRISGYRRIGQYYKKMGVMQHVPK